MAAGGPLGAYIGAGIGAAAGVLSSIAIAGIAHAFFKMGGTKTDLEVIYAPPYIIGKTCEAAVKVCGLIFAVISALSGGR
jgi:hypothetical protein